MNIITKDRHRRFTPFGIVLVTVLVAVLLSGIVFAKAEGVEAVTARPHPTLRVRCDFGWTGYSCTLDFDKVETQRIAAGGIAGSSLVAICAAALGPWGAVGCGIPSAVIVLGAQSAQAQGKCLTIRYGWWGGYPTSRYCSLLPGGGYGAY